MTTPMLIMSYIFWLAIGLAAAIAFLGDKLLHAGRKASRELADRIEHTVS